MHPLKTRFYHGGGETAHRKSRRIAPHHTADLGRPYSGHGKSAGACLCPDIPAGTFQSPAKRRLVSILLDAVYSIRLAWLDKPYAKKTLTAFADVRGEQKDADTPPADSGLH